MRQLYDIGREKFPCPAPCDPALRETKTFVEANAALAMQRGATVCSWTLLCNEEVSHRLRRDDSLTLSPSDPLLVIAQPASGISKIACAVGWFRAFEPKPAGFLPRPVELV